MAIIKTDAQYYSDIVDEINIKKNENIKSKPSEIAGRIRSIGKGGTLIIRTTSSKESSELKKITTAQLKQYATIGTITSWSDSEIRSEDIAKLEIDQFVRLFIHDSDRNKDVYILGIIREKTDIDCKIEGISVEDGMPQPIDSTIEVKEIGTSSVELRNGVIYRADQLDSLNFTLPTLQKLSVFEAEIDITAGPAPLQVIAPSDIDWMGDDIDSGAWVPIEDKRYVLYIYWDGVRYRAISQSQKIGG